MKRWIGVAILAIVVVCTVGVSLLQYEKVPEISVEGIMGHVERLADPALEGRETGSAGNKQAVSYIQSELEQLADARGLELTSQTVMSPVRRMNEFPTLSIPTDSEDDGVWNLEFMNEFNVPNAPRSGGMDFHGDLLLVSKSIYELDESLFKDKIVVTRMNRITNEYLDDVLARGAVGVLNNYTTSYDPGASLLREDTTKNLRVDWKQGNQIFIGGLSNKAFVRMQELAKEDLIEEYSNLDLVKVSGGTREKVTGLIHDVDIKFDVKYPVRSAENIIMKVPAKSETKDLLIISTDIDGYGKEESGEIIPSPAQAYSSGLLIELARLMTESERLPNQDVYFAFLNGSKQGDYGMRSLFDSLPEDRRIQWIHLQNAGGIGAASVQIGEALASTSERQWAIQLRMQLHASETGLAVVKGIPDEPVPGFRVLARQDIPHVIFSSGTDRFTAMNELSEIKPDEGIAIGKLIGSYLYRDVLEYDKPDYYTPQQVLIAAVVLILAILFALFNKIAKEQPGLEMMGKNIRFWNNTSLYRGASGLTYFIIPASLLMFGMIFLLLFPKMFVMAEYDGVYSGYSPYLYGKRTVMFIDNLMKNGFMQEAPAGLSLKGITSMVYGSFKLIIPALLLSIAVGIIKGAVDSYKPSDAKNFISLSLLSMPDVLVAFLGLQVIIMWSKNEGLVNMISIEMMRQRIMPVLALAIIPSIYVSRLALIAVEEERHKGYVKGVLAKGATKSQAFMRHLLPVMMMKIIDSMPSIMKILITNLIIVEYYYAYPGIANYLITHMRYVSLVLLLSMGIGMIYLILNAFFKSLSWIVNPMKRRGN